MYEVSDSFKTAIAKNCRKYSYHGFLVTNQDGAVRIPFSNSAIVQGSGSITSNICGTDDINIGTVYSSELKISLYVKDLDRYSTYGGTISLYFTLWLSDTESEDVPLGIFNISECTRTANILQFTAYDNMVKLDDEYSGQTYGLPYAMLTLACDKCGVTFGMTQDEVEALPNGKMSLGVYPTNDISTYRDLVSYVAQACACVATIDRTGQLVLKTYKSTSLLEIPQNKRFSLTLSDYTTHIRTVKRYDIVRQMYDISTYRGDIGLTLDLGTNPLVQYTNRENAMTSLTAITKSLGINVSYTPFSAEIPINPALDCGDCISFTGGSANASISCITALTLNVNGKMQIKGVGSNPRLLSARTATDKALSGLQSAATNGSVAVYTYTNTEEFSISTDETDVIYIKYTSNAATTPILIYTIPIDLTLDGNVCISTYVDGSKYAAYKKYLLRGSHTLTAMNHLTCAAGEAHEVTVILNFEYFASDFRSEVAARKTLDNAVAAIKTAVEAGSKTVTYDTVTPATDSGKISIAKGTIDAVIFAQGLASTSKWDGNLSFKGTFSPSEIGNLLTLTTLANTCSIDTQTPETSTFAETFSTIEISNLLTFDGATDTIAFNKVMTHLLIDSTYTDMTYSAADTTIVDGVFTVNAAATTPQMIYTGDIELTDSTILGLEQITAIAADTTLFAYSFDSGTTWLSYVSSAWVTLTEENSGQTAADMAAIGTTAWAEKITAGGKIKIRIAVTTTFTSINLDFLN
jgi:hypothetical protein